MGAAAISSQLDLEQSRYGLNAYLDPGGDLPERHPDPARAG
jgi:hypothetical protein